jgi:hypothetical protein
LPIVIQLMRHSPRLGWIAMLMVWLSPIGAAAAIHDAVERAMGRRAGRVRPEGWPLRGAASWWAGLFAWVTIIFVTVTTAFLMLVFDPPPIVDPDHLWDLAGAVIRGVSGAERSLTWIILAAYVYELERVAREDGPRAGQP